MKYLRPWDAAPIPTSTTPTWTTPFTAAPGQIDQQIAMVKQIEIQGKKITVPDRLKKNLGAVAEPAPDDKAKKKVEREARKKAREEAKSEKKKRPKN